MVVQLSSIVARVVESESELAWVSDSLVKDVDERLEKETRENDGRRRRSEPGVRRCGTCGKTGHNARTCKEDVETSGESSSE